MIYLLLTLLILILVALAARVSARRASTRTGLPTGRVLYSDTGFPVGSIGPIGRNAQGVKQEKPLRSQTYGLVGRPDYLVRTHDGIVPVEAKSTRCPADGRPYASHVMQLAAYCLLVENVTGADVPHGIIKYADREVIVEYTPELRDSVIELVEEMRRAYTAEDVHRSHDDARRCANCIMRDVCTEALA
jgi:CRISPR-associated exonuclease Cas4